MELDITGDSAADKLLNDDPFALLTGMLLNQQVTMASAFAGPEKISWGRVRVMRRMLRAARPAPITASIVARTRAI